MSQNNSEMLFNASYDDFESFYNQDALQESSLTPYQVISPAKQTMNASDSLTEIIDHLDNSISIFL